MPKQLNVNLAFTADTGKATREIQSLQSQLTKLMESVSQGSIGSGLTKELQESVQAAASLKAHLQQATNVNTGKLDLGLLNKSFKDAGVNLDSYRVKLQKLGPDGEQAFTTLANSILRAEVPLKQSSTLLNNFATTLKNTARWQISSSILHGFMGAIQSAVGYAQKLDKSLNSIQIITGQSASEMAEFAKEANRAAQALSTTTTEYTNASLVFYQQGLTGTDVTDRVNTVIKLANVTRESAGDISQEMTAIWNNFNDGSQSLEHYADVITALGATTASSSSEIAEGLQKFAAVADTVGLSYDYATAALATVTATTRQSAEIVGTAFKTLFGRLEGLKLGQTLDDGTTLNKYSAALESVGINIKDVDGQLKSMDTILDELGEKWKTLGKDQQVALAQTVGGVRQYTQLIALMDNYDFFQKNVETARDAEGTLEEQNQRYAKSWEAAQKRITASMEEIYNKLLDRGFFTDLADGIAGFTKLIGGAIDGIGGLQGALTLLGSVALKVFSKDLANSINKFIYNRQDPKAIAEDMRKQAISSFEALSGSKGENNPYQYMIGPQEALLRNAEKMSDIEKQTAQYLLDQHEVNVKNLADLQTEKEILDKKVENQEYYLKNQISASAKEGMNSGAKKTSKIALDNRMKEYEETAAFGVQTKQILISDNSDEEKAQKIVDLFKKINSEVIKVPENVKKIFINLAEGDSEIIDIGEHLQMLQEAIGVGAEKGGLLEEIFTNIKTTLKNATPEESQERINELLETYKQRVAEAAEKTGEFNQCQENVKNTNERLSNTFNNTQTKLMETGQFITSYASSLMSLGMAVNSIKGLFNVFTDVDMEPGERFVAILTSIGMAVPALMSAKETLNKLIEDSILRNALDAKNKNTATIANIENATSEELDAEAKKLNAMASREVAGAEGAEIGATEGLTVANTGLAASEGAAATGAGVLNGALNLLKAHPIIAAISGIIAALMLVTTVINGIKKAREDAYTSAKKERDAIKQETKEIGSLYQEYKKLKANLSDGVTAKEEYNKKTVELCNSLGLEGENVSDLIKKYGDLEQAIENARQKKLKEALTKNTAAAEAGVNTLKDKVQDAEGKYRGGKPALLGLGLAMANYSLNSKGESAIAKWQLDNPNEDNSYMGNLLYNKKIYDAINSGEIGNTKEEKAQLKSSETYKYLETLFNDSEILEVLNTVEEAKEENNKILLEWTEESISAEAQKVKTLEDEEKYEEHYKQLLQKTIEEQGLDPDKYDLDKIIELNNAKYSNITAAKNQKKNQEKLSEQFDNAEWIEQLNEEQAQLAANNIKLLVKLGIDDSSTPEEVKEAISKIQHDFDIKSASLALLSANNLIGEVQSGKVTSENIEDNKDYQNLITNLNNIKEKDEELQAVSEILNKTWLVGTQEYSEALEIAQNKLYKLDMEGAVKKAEEANKKFLELFETVSDSDTISLKAEIDDKEVQSALDDILNANYEIDIKVHTEAEQEFNSITQAYENLSKSASLIGENFVVAANDVRELNNTFPGILEGMEYVGDGTVRLNEQIVQSAMTSAEAEAQADAEATISKLQNQANLLRSKQQSYDTLATAAQTLATCESESDEEAAIARATISGELENLKQKNEDISAEKTLEDNETVANSSKDNAGVVAKNWAEGFKSMAQSSAAAARTAIQNMNAVQNNNAGSISEGTVNVNYTGSTGVKKEAKIIEETEKALENSGGDSSKQAWAKIAEKYRSLAEAAGKSVNDIEGMIAQVGASGQKIDNLLGNVSKGLGSSGGSSSGGGGSEKQKEVKEYQEDERDRYWDINNAIKANENSTKKLANAQQKLSMMQDHLFGKSLINNLKEQNKLSEKQIELSKQQKANYEALYAEQERELGELKGKLETFGATFSGDALTNYSSLLQSALDTYNMAVDTYNASAQEDADKQALEAAQARYTLIKDTISRYQTLYYNEMSDTQDKLEQETQKIMEEQLKQLERNLKAWEVKIQVELDTQDARKQWNEFLKNTKQDFKKLFKDLSIDIDLDKDNFEATKKQVYTVIKDINHVLGEIDKIKSGEGSKEYGSISEAQKALEEKQGTLAKYGEESYEAVKAAWEAYLEGMDQAIDEFDFVDQQYEQMNDELEYSKELIELTYGEKAYKQLKDYYDTKKDLNASEIKSVQKEIAFWKDRFNKEIKATGADEKDITTWSEAAKKAYDQLISKQKTYNSLVTEGYKLLQEDLQNNVNAELQALEESMYGMSLEDFKKDWDYMNKMSSEYLDDIQKAYKIETLSNKMNKGINSTSSLAAQQKLQKARDKELKSLREKEKLSQTDLDIAEARYEIALKEVALEEAQDQKTSMKLTRDISGNWTYQYVADEEDIANKQQELLDANQQYYEIANEGLKHFMELGMQLHQEFNEQVRALYSDPELLKNPELFYEKLEGLGGKYLPEIQKAFGNVEEFKREAMIATTQQFATICKQDEKAYDSLNKNEQKLVDETKKHKLNNITDLRDSIIKGFYPDLNSIASSTFNEINYASKIATDEIIKRWNGSGDQTVKAKITKAIKDIKTDTQAYQKYLSGDWQRLVGTEWDNHKKKIGETKSKIGETETLTKTYADTSKTKLEALIKVVNSLAKAWEGVAKDIDKTKKSIDEYLKVKDKINPKVENPVPKSSSSGSSSSSGGSSGGEVLSNESSNSQYTDEEIAWGIAKNIHTYGSWGDGTPRYERIAERYGWDISNRVREIINYEYRNGPGQAHSLRDYSSDIWGYDTGGYTGSWDATGRLALLHQKELVLNQKDTQNILETVSTVRDLAKLNDSISSSIANSIGMMATSIIANKGGSINTNNDNSSLTNQFYITAEFPNANDVDTIREAILNLPNLASQYIHQK